MPTDAVLVAVVVAITLGGVFGPPVVAGGLSQPKNHSRAAKWFPVTYPVRFGSPRGNNSLILGKDRRFFERTVSRPRSRYPAQRLCYRGPSSFTIQTTPWLRPFLREARVH